MKNNIKLFFAFSIIVLILSICMFGDKLDFEQQESILTTSEIINEDSPLKNTNIDIELSIDGNKQKFDDLQPTDLLYVSAKGGQSPISTLNLLSSKGYTTEQCFNLMYSNWNELLNKFLSSYEIEPTDSVITFNPDNKDIFEYTQSSNGKKINQDYLYNQLKSQLNKNGVAKIDLTLSVAYPNFSIEKNKEITSEVSHFITDLSTSKKNRHHNVTKALEKLNGIKINPKEVVSFNKLTAPHDSSGGYINATIISNGEYVDGMGGGICQASTTLYNALLLAGLKVIEVTKHSIPVHYVKLGLDSMVSSYSDLVFENTSKYPIYIKAYTDKESAYVYLYGKTFENGERIVRRNEIVRTIEPPKTITIIDTEKKYYPKIEYTDESFVLKYDRKGYEVNAYLDYYDKNNKIIKSEKIRHEIYRPQGRIIVTGAKERVDTESNKQKTNTQ